MNSLTQWLRNRPIRPDARFVLIGILEELGPQAVARALEYPDSAGHPCLLAVALGEPDAPLPTRTAEQRALLRARFAATTRHAPWLADWVMTLWRRRQPAVRALVREWLRAESPGGSPSSR